jgi:hypothetical protein
MSRRGYCPVSDKPLAVDLFCGLGGWSEGLIAEGYRVVGFDNERHVYGEAKYPAQLVLQDVLTIHGAQFKDAALNRGLAAVPGLQLSGDAVEAGQGAAAAG